MTINNVKTLVEAELAGYSQFSTWRKAPTQTTAATYWFDLAMSPGNPSPNYYASAPNVSVALSRSENGGLNHGGNVSPSKKFLTEFCALGTTPATVVPLPMMLCDYLMYYPFVDMSVMDFQDLDNQATITRYTDGEGVQIMAVVVAPPLGSGNPRFQVRYTNSDGVTDRLTRWVATGTQTVNGTIISSGSPITNTNVSTVGPFLPLEPGDKGVRSIEQVNFIDVDVGLVTFVLVKPLASFQLREITAAVETNFLMHKGVLPQIEDDAYLNLICCPAGTLAAGQIHGYLKTVWS